MRKVPSIGSVLMRWTCDSTVTSRRDCIGQNGDDNGDRTSNEPSPEQNDEISRSSNGSAVFHLEAALDSPERNGPRTTSIPDGKGPRNVSTAQIEHGDHEHGIGAAEERSKSSSLWGGPAALPAQDRASIDRALTCIWI